MFTGYANEVGEAFRSIIGSKWVAVSYGIATAYVIADTVDKTKKMHNVGIEKQSKVNLWLKLRYGFQVAGTTKKTAFVAADTLTWQMLASVAIPGFTINRICATASFLLKKRPKLAKKWTVTLIGLSAIPFIIKPIDDFVDKVLDETLRKYAP